MTALQEPPYPYGYRLALLRCWGREEEADRLLRSLNMVQRAFDCPDYIMPEALQARAEEEAAELRAKYGSQLTDPVEGDPFLKHRRRAA